MATFEQIASSLKSSISGYSNFKIGKTGQTLEDRFGTDYKEDYAYMKQLGYSDSSSTIDNLEEYLIKEFMNYSNCDNEQVGGGEMASSKKYIVYLVYNS
jgi:hypothetical protein